MKSNDYSVGKMDLHAHECDQCAFVFVHANPERVNPHASEREYQDSHRCASCGAIVLYRIPMSAVKVRRSRLDKVLEAFGLTA